MGNPVLSGIYSNLSYDHYWQGVALVSELINGFKSRTGENLGCSAISATSSKRSVMAVGGYWQAGNNLISVYQCVRNACLFSWLVGC